jgi:hypothetical protein
MSRSNDFDGVVLLFMAIGGICEKSVMRMRYTVHLSKVSTSNAGASHSANVAEGHGAVLCERVPIRVFLGTIYQNGKL